jgi:hypothetical protein
MNGAVMRAVVAALVFVFAAGSWTVDARAQFDQPRAVIVMSGYDGPMEQAKAGVAAHEGCLNDQADRIGIDCNPHTAACGVGLVRVWENSTFTRPPLSFFTITDPLHGLATRPPRRPPKDVAMAKIQNITPQRFKHEGT